MELLRDAKSNGGLLLLKTLLLGLVLIAVYHVSAFSESADSAIDRSFSAKAEVDLYSVTDTLTDPDRFAEARQNPQYLDDVGRFYNLLNTEASFTWLSVFDQPVPIADFRAGDQFGPASEGGLPNQEFPHPITGKIVKPAAAFQLNRKAFDFYHLSVDRGTAIPWESVDYSTGTIPVLLGSEYRGIYDIGETLEGNLYSADLRFTVSGFLKPNSSIFFKGAMNTFLDRSIVIPYPSELGPVTDENAYVQGILAFAMINGDIAVDRTFTSDSVLLELARISRTSGFSDYALLNTPAYLAQYHLMKEIIQQNRDLLIALSILTFGSALLINGAVSSVVLRRRGRGYFVLWIQGVAPAAIYRRNALMACLEYLVLAIAVTIALSEFPSRSQSSLLVALALAGTAFLFDLGLQSVALRRSLASPAPHRKARA